ncbi:MAG: hypothetical protein AAF497_25720, partial [Planctomycetota bacterium]
IPLGPDDPGFGQGCNEYINRGQDASGNPLPPVTQGGNAYAVLRSEIRLPLTESISVDFFVDTGNLWVDVARAIFPGRRLSHSATVRFTIVPQRIKSSIE